MKKNTILLIGGAVLAYLVFFRKSLTPAIAAPPAPGSSFFTPPTGANATAAGVTQNKQQQLDANSLVGLFSNLFKAIGSLGGGGGGGRSGGGGSLGGSLGGGGGSKSESRKSSGEDPEDPLGTGTFSFYIPPEGSSYDPYSSGDPGGELGAGYPPESSPPIEGDFGGELGGVSDYGFTPGGTYYSGSPLDVNPYEGGGVSYLDSGPSIYPQGVNPYGGFDPKGFQPSTPGAYTYNDPYAFTIGATSQPNNFDDQYASGDPGGEADL